METFATPGAASFQVPRHVHRITVDILGAAGGRAGGSGGAGGEVTATFRVAPCETFTSDVGGMGHDGAINEHDGLGGVNGGGDGGAGGGFTHARAVAARPM